MPLKSDSKALLKPGILNSGCVRELPKITRDSLPLWLYHLNPPAKASFHVVGVLKDRMEEPNESHFRSRASLPNRLAARGQ